MTLGTERIRTLDQLRAFLEGNEAADFHLADRDSAYAFVRRTLVRFQYHHGLGRPDKGRVREFLGKVTGLSPSQLRRLIAQHHRTGHIRDHRKKPPARPFTRRYTRAGIVLLAEVDEACGHPSGRALKEVLRRQCDVFGDPRFERLATISNGHIYNLRASRAYRLGRLSFRTTSATSVPIGTRRKPRPDGRPGFLRVDTVHQGDKGGEKGIYIINVVDEVTQFQHLGAVRRVTEYFLVPQLEALINAFPFQVKGFHADNGSEYINHRVAALLTKLHIGEFTKSRPRHSNDNALVESKNGSVVRKWLGHTHIPVTSLRSWTPFSATRFPPLNLHRPCLFATEVAGANGRVKKRYRQNDVATPYDRFRSLPDAASFLKPGVTFQLLDRLASATTDLDAAKTVQQDRIDLFRAVDHARTGVAPL